MLEPFGNAKRYNNIVTLNYRIIFEIVNDNNQLIMRKTTSGNVISNKQLRLFPLLHGKKT